jgi:hypothetical protein
MTARPRRLSSSSPAGLLRAGAALIERCGWYRGDYWPGHHLDRPYCEGDPVCALGALYAAAGAIPGHRGRSLDAAKDALAELLGYEPEDHAGIPTWNDDPARQAGEVVALLRDAADRLDPGSQEASPVPAGDGDQPGGHIRQDTPAGLALPTDESGRREGDRGSEEIAMVEPAKVAPAAPGGRP